MRFHGLLRAFILVLAGSTVFAGGAREEVVRDFDKTAALPSGRTLRVSHEHGDVVIRTHALPEVRIHAKIRASAAPWPRAPPVTNATRPSSSPMWSSLKRRGLQSGPACGAEA